LPGNGHGDAIVIGFPSSGRAITEDRGKKDLIAICGLSEGFGHH
jgi:hypothetical protein